MSNPPCHPPPWHPPSNQWCQVPPPPIGNPPWNFQPLPNPPPPVVYPNTLPPYHPAFPTNASPFSYPHPPNVLPAEVSPLNIPFANVPPPNFPPPIGVPLQVVPFSVPSPVGVPLPMQIDPGFPPPNMQGFPPNLRLSVSELYPIPDDQRTKDPRKAAKRERDFLADRTDTKYLLLDSNGENGFLNYDSDTYSELNTSQEETDIFGINDEYSSNQNSLGDIQDEPADELRSKIYQLASDVLVRKKADDDVNLQDKQTREYMKSIHSINDINNPSPDQRNYGNEQNNVNKNPVDQKVGSHSRKRSSKSRSPKLGGSPNRNSTSSNRRTRSHFRNKSSRSPSRSEAFPNQTARSLSRDRLSRSTNSSSQEYKASKYSRDGRSRNRSNWCDQDDKGKSGDNRSSLGHRWEYIDRSRSRNNVPDNSRDRKYNERDRSSASKDSRSCSASTPSSHDVKDSLSNRVKNRRDSDSGDKRNGNHKSKQTDKDSKSRNKGSVKDKTGASSCSKQDKKLKSPKKSSPKAKCVNPKLELYDNIWRKVRGKQLTSGTQIKLSTGKILPASRDKEEEENEYILDENNAEIIEDNSSQVCSSSKEKDNSEKPAENLKPQEKDEHKSSNTNGVEKTDSRIEKRGTKRYSGNYNQPCLSSEPSKWIKSTPAEYYYLKAEDSNEVVANDALKELHKKFEYELVDRGSRAKAYRPKYEPPQRKIKLREHKPVEPHPDGKSSSSSCSDSSSDEEYTSMEELERKRSHPDRLHPELWFNDPNEMNDGPLCRCSAKARRSGIRHGIYVGEVHLPPCSPYSNNAKRLHHYKICIKPVTNFLTKTPTYILHGKHMYIFEGFSLFSHKPLPNLPNCKVIRFNYEYTLMYVEEAMPTNFTVAGLELFGKFLFQEVLELVDLDWKAHNDPDGCPQFHFMPRFARKMEGDGKELLSLNVVMEYLLRANKLLMGEKELPELMSCSSKQWQNLADKVKGMIVTCPGMKPSSVRVDQLDREHIESGHDKNFPVIVHFGVRPPQLSYAGNPLYQKAWRNYVKFRHLLANKPKVTYADRRKLTQKELKLQEMRMENDLKRDVTVVISSKGFYQTGLMSDVVQHAMLIPILVCHLRFHASLTKLEDKIECNFEDRFLLQLALTHPSYRENFGTNPDHARNSLTNCGLRQPQYGDRRIHYMNTRKRGINTLINIMSRFGQEEESASRINHNERLEFLGDAVVEFLSSTHLFYMFPDLEEGGLATYRAAIVQNQHLALLSKKLELDTFMLYAHGSDLCHDLELRHAMANCFEALMGALFLDAGIEVADKVFSNTLFPEPELKEVWMNYPLHPLQEQEPNGDRRWIESIPLLQKINEFEEQIGIEFTHIRLLARALTHRSLGFNNLTLGSNQRLEFLGDTVLQLVASEYLYKFFPQHHEGHLSLLRSSLVNNRTQAVVCGDLGMVEYAIYPYFKVELKPKDKADLLEAFLGALYIDKDLGYCRKFCEVCFFPRLQDFIMNQDWNDPKSKLQQCCLTLRSMDGGEPDIPTYKVIECKGPTNTRVYGVAVYFQGNRLAVGEGHSIQQAEMDAAGNALAKSKDLFPQLRHQKRAIERSLRRGSKSKSKDKKRAKNKAKDR